LFVYLAVLFTPYSKKKQPLPPKHLAVLVRHLGHVEQPPGLGQELHVGPPPLLEAKVDRGRRVELEEVRQRPEEEGEGGLEVDAVGREHDGGLEGRDLVAEWLAPVGLCGGPTPGGPPALAF
jgi:hypothetical protein